MSGDKTQIDNRDRFRLAGGKNFEVDYLVQQAGITREQAQELIKRFGNDRETLFKHARDLRIGGRRRA